MHQSPAFVIANGRHVCQQTDSGSRSDEHDPGALDEADRKMLLRDDGEPAQPAKKKG
jgi:hypothetical protein